MSEDQQSNIATQIKHEAPVRDNLVSTAVNFLANPDVRNRPDQSKETFLKKKGLTDVEISLAFQMAGNDATTSITRQSKNLVKFPDVQSHSTYSFWYHLRNVGSSFIILGVALYGLHQFYKMYVEEWLFQKKKQPGVLEQQLIDMNLSIIELKKTVSVLEEGVKLHKQQIDNIFLGENYGYQPTPIALSELKADVGSVKSLLMGRHQFPAAPKVAGTSIPIWQLPTSEDSTKQTDQNVNEEVVATDCTSDQAVRSLTDQELTNESCEIEKDSKVSEELALASTTNAEDINGLDVK